MLLIAVSILAVPVLTPIVTTAASPSHFAAPADAPPLAKRGDRSATVKKLQQLLSRAGITVAGGADGIFGPGTEAAVKEYQTRRGLTVNGVLDLATATVLGMVDPTPILRRGSRGDAVRDMQQQLITVGLNLVGGADGVYGSATVATVRLFQQNQGLAVTGSVDIGTAVILANAAAALTPTTTPPTTTAPPTTAPPAPPPPTTTPPVTSPPTTTPPNVVLLSMGARGEAVKTMQRQLIAAGISVFGGADGIFGSATRAALKQFQTRAGLSATGSLDTVTNTALVAAATPPTTTTPPTTPPTTAPPNVVLLSIGARGESVKTMQTQLIAAGISVFGGADGIFGTATQAALKQFQTRAGLPATGSLDTATNTALVAAAGPPPPPSDQMPLPPGTVVLSAFPVSATCAFWDTFGAPRSGGRKHEGVDIIASSGIPIYAVLDGKITKKQLTYAGSLGGNALWLTAADGSGSYFFYAHLSDFAPGIEVGSAVAAGDVIGYVGATGNASVPHLHFEVHPHGGRAVDPYPIVKAASSC